MGPTEFIHGLKNARPAPAYFLRGPDRFLHQECRDAVVAAVPEESRQWCLTDVEFHSGELQRELEAADQIPMLGGHCYFIFSDPNDFKSAADEDVEALQAYLAKPSPFATLVFSATEPDRRRRFIQLLEKKTQLVEMLPLNRAQASAWVKDFLALVDMEIEPFLAEGIAAKFEASESSRDNSGGGVNLLWLRTELEKLLVAKTGARRIDESDLDLIVSFREEREIGKLLRAMAERKCQEALEFLQALLGSKVAETLLLWCIGDLVRQALKSGHAPGYSKPKWGGRGGNPFATWEIAPVAAKNYTPEELMQALRVVRRADLRVKSSWKDSHLLLEFLVWQIIVGKSSEGEGGLSEELPAPSA
jgi:DNA polymerase III delta subunit